MTDSEFVEYVWIGTGDVGNSVVAKHEALEHRLVDRTTNPFLVGPYWFEASFHYCRRDDILVDGIEICDSPCRVYLRAKRHEHETDGGQRLEIFQRKLPCVLPGKVFNRGEFAYASANALVDLGLAAK